MSNSSKIKFTLGLLIILVMIISVWLIRQKFSSHLTPDKFAQAYVDLAVAYETSGSDVSKWKKEKERILKEHDLSLEKVNQFIKRYNRDPQKWAFVWEKIVDLLRQRQESPAIPFPPP